ncbi:protein-disulfide reductase DsbD domain-containing protein [Robertkochia flava]|uniref:protein-disulfide reductase DsbD domain-containing protein n=1 Tax=Robertkochia flava TaxID=3447986 RepID=UPI001CCED0B6|nr:protein-disulfide reductase DsbD domain-containing protein [Robertkochia marina]
MGFSSFVFWIFLLHLQAGWVEYRGSEVGQRGDVMDIWVHFTIGQGYHIQSSDPEDDQLIPTRVDVDLPEGWELLDVEFPETESFRLEGTQQVLQVYSKELTVQVSVRVPEDFSGLETFEGILHYQACDHAKCYFPRALEFSVDLW